MHKAYYAATFAALFCLIAVGQEHTSETHTFNYDRRSAIERALNFNKDLIAARVAITQAEARLEAVGLFPNPSVTFDYQDDFLFNDEGEQTLGLGISQSFPIAGKLEKQKNLSRFDVEIAKLEVRQKELELISEVSEFALDIHVVDTRSHTLERLAGKLEETVDFADLKASTGEISSLDANRLKLELRVIEQEMRNLELQRERLLHRMAPLLGHPATEHFHFDSENALPYSDSDLPTYESKILERSPQHQLAVLRKQMAEAQVKLALAENWDDLTASLFWKSETSIDEPIGRKKDQLLGVSISVPLPLRRKGDLKAKQYRIEQTGSLLAAEAIEFQIQNEVEHAHHEAVISRDRMESYKAEVISFAEQQLEEVRVAYQNGQIDMLSLLQAQQSIVSLENGYLDHYVEYAHALIELEFARADYE